MVPSLRKSPLWNLFVIYRLTSVALKGISLASCLVGLITGFAASMRLYTFISSTCLSGLWWSSESLSIMLINNNNSDKSASDFSNRGTSSAPWIHLRRRSPLCHPESWITVCKMPIQNSPYRVACCRAYSSAVQWLPDTIHYNPLKLFNWCVFWLILCREGSEGQASIRPVVCR